MRIITACIIIVILLVPFSSGAYSSTSFVPVDSNSAQIQEALDKFPPLRFLPSHPLYFVITLKENFSRFFKSSAVKRAEFDLSLSDKRLKESYLLINSGRADLGSKNLARYSSKLNELNKQVEKAGEQNQAIVPLAANIASDLRLHEIILSTLYENQNLSTSLGRAISSFRETANLISDIDPELTGRFKSIELHGEYKDVMEATSTPDVLTTPFPSVTPKRIIY